LRVAALLQRFGVERRFAAELRDARRDAIGAWFNSSLACIWTPSRDPCQYSSRPSGFLLVYLQIKIHALMRFSGRCETARRFLAPARLPAFASKSPPAAKNERGNEQDDEYDEQDLGDSGSRSGNAEEAEKPGNERNDQKHNGVVQHGFPLR
jgi:hypothetical protein